MARSETRRAASGILTAVLAVLVSGCSPQAVVPRWDPVAFRDLSTLEFLTVGADEGPHWSTVWLAVVDDQVYIRLGTRAAGRMQANTTTPFVDVRIGGREYRRVRAVEAPEMASRVATVMGAKYPSDLLIRHVPHPLTMRLEPDAASTS
ncbi:MAG: hypothetical protein IT293_05600 [Deltaproteobacteria bacterium]|nr:hypothetical protein [Deltaproteobacteria bacterium]